MTDVAHILGEFVAAWNAGERPRMDAYLDRVPPAERDDLADQIETFILLAPEPEYDESTWAEMTAAPMVASVAAASMEASPPEPLGSVRERAGLTLTQLAERLGFSGAKRDKAARYLEEVERGTRAPSRSLLERLGGVLGGAAGGFAAPSPAASPAFGLPRAAGEASEHSRMDPLADALLSDDEEFDEVDRLFSEEG